MMQHNLGIAFVQDLDSELQIFDYFEIREGLMEGTIRLFDVGGLTSWLHSNSRTGRASRPDWLH
jgi:hypothetical protein